MPSGSGAGPGGTGSGSGAGSGGTGSGGGAGPGGTAPAGQAPAGQALAASRPTAVLTNPHRTSGTRIPAQPDQAADT